MQARSEQGRGRRGEASPCADVRGGWGGADDIGRDGTRRHQLRQTRSGSQLRTRSGVRTLPGVLYR
nr:MAG TPA: hypothetical protein [Caudoviricetes sp.]